MLSMEFKGKNVQKAIEAGLNALNKTLDEVDIKILSLGGLFRKAKVLISLPELERIKSAGVKIRKEFSEREALPPSKGGKNNQDTSDQSLKDEQQRLYTQQKLNAGERLDALSNKHERLTFSNKNDTQVPKPYVQSEAVPISDEFIEKSKAYLSGLLEKMNIKADVTTKLEGDEFILNISGGTGAVIGYRGEVLDAIEVLTSMSMPKLSNCKLVVDSCGYREKRYETLVTLAKRKAEKVIKTGRKEVLEPMSSSARRMVHAALSENDKVITKSEGKEPTRYIVILPKTEQGGEEGADKDFRGDKFNRHDKPNRDGKGGKFNKDFKGDKNRDFKKKQ